MPEANASDVQLEIGTTLGRSEITGVLERIEREWQREYMAGDFAGTDHIRDFEAALAALRIAEGRDRRAEQAQSGRSSITYETSEIANLRKRVRRLDPGDEFGHAGTVVRDTDRFVTSTDE